MQCVGEENWVDSRTIYIGHREPPPGTEAFIQQRFPDNRIVSSKVRWKCPHNIDVNNTTQTHDGNYLATLASWSFQAMFVATKPGISRQIRISYTHLIYTLLTESLGFLRLQPRSLLPEDPTRTAARGWHIGNSSAPWNDNPDGWIYLSPSKLSCISVLLGEKTTWFSLSSLLLHTLPCPAPSSFCWSPTRWILKLKTRAGTVWCCSQCIYITARLTLYCPH